MTANRAALAIQAVLLRELHQVGAPLILVNAWDVESARQIEAAGCAAIATSTAAFANSIGEADDNTMPGNVVFDFVRRVSIASSVPVTVDLEGGYDLAADDLVGQLLDAGAVGCNIEDSNHRAPGSLLEPTRQAERIAQFREAARRAEVDVVINPRIDTLIRHADRDPAANVDEILHRGRLYLDAGADCVYPIQLFDPPTVRHVVESLAAPVNANVHPSVTIGALADAGAARISIGPMAFRTLMTDLRRRTQLLLSGDTTALVPT